MARLRRIVCLTEESTETLYLLGEEARIVVISGLTVCPPEARTEQYRANLEAVRNETSRLPRRPRVYFKEWDNPLISAIRWVSELIGIASGEKCFPELTTAASVKDRIIADPNEVVRRVPDIIIGSRAATAFAPSG